MRTNFPPSPHWGLSSSPPLRLIPTACLCLLTVASLIASPVFAQAQATNTTAATTDLRQKALSYRNAQDYDKAIQTYQSLLAQNPSDAVSIKVELGLTYKARKDYSNAMPLFTEVAASQDRCKAQAMFYMEDCFSEQGRLADAIAVLTRAYTECPEARAEILLRRAERQCAANNYKGGLGDYQEFIAKYPERTDIITSLSGRMPEIKLRAAGLFDGPASGLETEWANAKSAGTDPAYIKLVGFRLADCCLRDQLWAKGAEVHASLINDYPADAPSLKMALGLCQKGLKEYDKATQTFDEIAAADKAQALAALFFSEDCLSEQGRYTECVNHLTKMLSEHPEAKAEILMRRAARLGDLGKCEDCLADLLAVQKQYPERSAEAKLGEGLTRVAIWEQNGDESQLRNAIRTLENYGAQFPKEAVFAAAARFYLGMYNLCPTRKVSDQSLAGSLEKGRAIMEDAIKNLPETSYTWWMKTECAASYSKEGRDADCVAALNALLAQTPPSSWKEYILYLLGETQLRMGKTEDGKATLSGLVSLFPNGEWGSLGARRLAALENGR